ncbi:hypothetical protein BU17DRAFT_97917 [Hysterangium stoloniferum]|nr:hypothetical protein BU17DRAFT_97917 [Hysterangium stoloniferum]
MDQTPECNREEEQWQCRAQLQMTSPSDCHRHLAVNNHDVPPAQPFPHAHGVAGQSDNPFLVAQQPPELPHHNVIAAGGSAAGGSAAGGSAAGGSAAGGSAAGGSAAGGSAAGGSAAGRSVAAGSATGRSAAGGSAAGRSVAGGSVAGSSVPIGSAAMDILHARQRNTTAQPQAPTAQLAPVDQAIQPAIGSVAVAALHSQYATLPPLQQPAQPQPPILQSAPHPHHGHQPGNVPVQPQLPVQQNHPSALHYDHPPIHAVQQIQAQLFILQLAPPPPQQPPMYYSVGPTTVTPSIWKSSSTTTTTPYIAVKVSIPFP